MNEITAHYGSDGLTSRILKALEAAGHDLSNVDPGVLAGADEFHLGGRAATERVVEAISRRNNVVGDLLDIGSGTGGSARTLSRGLGCQVTGIDLTSEFVETAISLSELSGAAGSTTFSVGSATEIPFEDDTFDVITMFHVGMNIDDKSAMASEFARVLRPRGTLAVYDIMRIGDGEITFPVPWASTDESSFVVEPDRYVEVISSAGFTAVEMVDQRELVLSVMKAASEQPPNPVNLGVVMGADFPTMIANLMTLVRGATLSPILMTATAPVG